MQPPTFTVGGAGVSGLYDGLYEGLLERTEINAGILRMCFGESEGRQTHPIARYCSALVQALAYQTLSEARIYDVDAFADRLSGRLSEGLGDLRDTMRALVGPRPGSEPFFSVSFSACRLETVGEGMYDLDIFSAGDFSLFLLDRHGMSPLWTKLSELLSEDSDCPLERHHLRLVHSEPFALILLSRSACEPVLSDRRGMAEHPGLLWRHRCRSIPAWLPDIPEPTGKHLPGYGYSPESGCQTWSGGSGRESDSTASPHHAEGPMASGFHCCLSLQHATWKWYQKHSLQKWKKNNDWYSIRSGW